MRKMKDMRGSHVSAVRTAIFRKFGLQLASSRRKNSRDIMDWKQSKEVKDSHNKLFTEDTAIEEITNSAFPSLSNADDEKFNDMYIYTASVCDIILNPNCPTLEISKPEMELRLEKFRVSIDFILLFKKIEFILLFKKLNLLIKIKIRKHLMKKVKLILAIQRLKKCLTFLAKINLPMIMKMKRDQPKTNRYITIQILILNRMIACLISGNYFDLFYF
jgi:hypothetical protein